MKCARCPATGPKSIPCGSASFPGLECLADSFAVLFSAVTFMESSCAIRQSGNPSECLAPAPEHLYVSSLNGNMHFTCKTKLARPRGNVATRAALQGSKGNCLGLLAREDFPEGLSM